MFCVLKSGDQLVLSDCSNPQSWVVLSKEELNALRNSPFDLDPHSAVQLSGVILMAMAIAFILRMLRKLLDDPPKEE